MWAKWRKLVSEQGRSGQSVAAFLPERGLCAPQFYAWKKRLREADVGQGEFRTPLTKFMEVQLAPAGWGGAGTGLVGATREPSAAGRVASGRRCGGGNLLKNGRSLRVGPGFDAELVRALMAVVESAA